MLYLRLLICGWQEAAGFAWHMGAARGSWRRGAATSVDASANRTAAVLSHASRRPARGGRARTSKSARVDRMRAAARAWRSAKYAAVAAVAVAGLAASAFVAGLALFYEQPKSFEVRHLRNARAAVTDRDGELVGAAPGPHGARVAPVTDDEARMAAIVVHDVPPVWWDVAVALEDRRFGKPGWIYGVDMLALPNLLTGRGASTLPMQLVGNLSGAKVDQRAHRGSFLWKVRRKLKEIASTPSLVASTADDNYLWLKRLIATHLPVMHGQIGGSTIGVAGGAWILFGMTPAQLSRLPGHQAILAAALQRNIVIKREPDDAVRKTWAYVKQRGKLGLALAYPDPADPRRKQGIADIDAMPDVPPLFFADDIPLSARAHVVHRRNFTARTVVTHAQAELLDLHGATALSAAPIRRYELTLSSMDNFGFKQRMDAAATELTQKLGSECRLWVPLARDGFDPTLFERMTAKPRCAPADFSKAERAHVIAVLANEQGEIIRFYQSGSDEPIYAGVAGRAENDGRYLAAAEIRDAGSIAKLVAAIALAEEGDTPDQRYCRQYYEGKLDSDGTTGFADCSIRGAKISARQAFAQSSNLAVLWRLRQIPRSRLRSLAVELGVSLAADVDPAYALAFGQVRVSPRHMHSLMHAIGKTVLERSGAGSSLIHVVKRVDEGQGLTPVDTGFALPAGVIQRHISNAYARLFVREVLSAVLTQPNGTMRFLKGFKPDSGGVITAHIGKTGTPVNTHNVATDKIVTGSLIVDGAYFSYFFLVRAPNPAKHPLGDRLSARHFAPLLRLLLNEIPGPLARSDSAAHGCAGDAGIAGTSKSTASCARA